MFIFEEYGALNIYKCIWIQLSSIALIKSDNA